MEMPGEATRILKRMESGDRDAVSDLLPLVYDELRRRAAAYIAREQSGQTLQATALVHEAFIRLIGQDRVSWKGRAHFMAVAATHMRRILVEAARREKGPRRGGDWSQKPLSGIGVAGPEIELLALDEALTELETFDLQRKRIVEMRFFGGMSHSEIAAVLGVTRRTVDRGWDLARRWLYARLRRGGTECMQQVQHDGSVRARTSNHQGAV